jgi:hypothetical protein
MQAVMPATIEDFIVLTEEKNLVYYQTDPDIKGQYKRTTQLVQETDAGGNLTDMVRVTVTVEYRKLGNRYPASIVLTTLRGR